MMKKGEKSPFFIVLGTVTTGPFLNSQIIWEFENTYSFEKKNLLAIIEMRPDKLQNKIEGGLSSER